MTFALVSTSSIVGIADNAANIATNAAAISSNDGDILSISNDVAAATRCTALNWDYNCCTSANPCGLNQGDCDSDDECSGDLSCGLDNCIGFGVTDADCCMVDGIAANAANIASNAAAISSNAAEIVSISADVAAATRCTGILNYDPSCCTSANPCGLNQGDCDSDSDCQGDLRCGLDNCMDVAPGFTDALADCCIDGLRHHVSEGT